VVKQLSDYRDYADASIPALVRTPDHCYLLSTGVDECPNNSRRLRAIAHFIDWEIRKLGLSSEVRSVICCRLVRRLGCGTSLSPVCGRNVVCAVATRAVWMGERCCSGWMPSRSPGHLCASMFQRWVNEVNEATGAEKLTTSLCGAGRGSVNGRDVRLERGVWGAGEAGKGG